MTASRVTNGALIFTTAYSVVDCGPRIAEAKVRTALDEAGLPFERILASPTPFNTVFWRAIVIESETYLNAYTSVVGGDVRRTAMIAGLISSPPRRDPACRDGRRFLQRLLPLGRG